MRPLRRALAEYLALRRSVGFRLAKAERHLRHFVHFLETQGADHITLALALAWATQGAALQPATWAQRLTAVRGFARHRSASDPRTQVPPVGVLPFQPRRARPHLYTLPEIQRLLAAAQAQPPLRGATYACLLGLLAVTGLRLGEALALAPTDVDLGAGVLTVRHGKFGKARLVPVHGSTQRALATYARQRDAWLDGRPAPTFLVSDRGRPLAATTVRETFIALSCQTGLRGPADSHGPRLHDFRHRFAVETLLGWYRAGADVERHLPTLTTYLGHAHVSHTYWYLSACPELLGLATARLERRWEAHP
jgi:integrase/recombinase XerD